jgi:hypothetical protein
MALYLHQFLSTRINNKKMSELEMNYWLWSVV